MTPNFPYLDQMKYHSPPPMFIIISTILLIPISSHNRLVLGVDDSFEICSVPKSCGNQTISYPFYIQGIQNQSCGYPGFQISCDTRGRPILNLSGDDYLIHQISYDDNSLVVSNAALAATCLPLSPIRNLSLPNDNSFYLAAPNAARLALLYNCSAAVAGDRICRGDNNSSVVAVPESRLAEAAERCGPGRKVVTVPALRYEEGIGVREALSEGFRLNWTAGDCKFCNSTGGKCGFDYTVHQFRCFCPDRPHAARCDPPGAAKDKLALKLGLGIGLPLGLVICLVIAFFICRRYLRRRNASNIISRNASNSEAEAGSIYYGVPVFSYKELEEATNNFDSEKELGDGGFGTVYFGVLKDGREVAVKRLYEHNYKRVEQFMNEIDILTRLRHKNLVSLYGCTSRRSRELLLVYEYVPNGTVADHLHGDRAQTSPLAWPIRMSIAIETASALAYLHASDTVHRDVKTNNILLDNNFSVKVADFGLSRLFPNDVTHVSTAPQGTPGYVDPEYHQCYQLTSKSDVYSFGVVLMELISSMPAVDITRHRHEINLSNLAISKIQKQAYGELIDPSLGFESDFEAKRMTIGVARLAFLCLKQDKEMRPTMEEVLEELKMIQNGKSEAESQEGFDMCVVRSTPEPECDEVCLLKNMEEEPPSPNTVTEIWHSSRTTTPDFSG